MSALVSIASKPTAPTSPPFKDMVWIPGGSFLMGSDHHYAEEAPAHSTTVAGFWIDRYQVSNAQFRRFVKATGYVTVAERAPTIEEYPDAKPDKLVPGSVIFKQPPGRVDLGNHYNWWDWLPGADWRHPEGPGSTLDGRDRHPVVHVAWSDVAAYAAWASKDLPTEAEWEYAARGGLDGKAYAWGDELAPNGRLLANYWQGTFPWQNLNLDGYERTAPVGSFPPNGYGLSDMIGNVWEWTSDWYADRHELANDCCGSLADEAKRTASVDPRQPGLPISRRVLKGGSFACAENYCKRYRPAARMAQPIDTGTCHIGFRCIVRPPLPAGRSSER